MKDVWSEELKEWQQRSLKGKEYVYFWVDGIHFGARMEDASQCMLVVIGATKYGAKELLTIVDCDFSNCFADFFASYFAEIFKLFCTLGACAFSEHSGVQNKSQITVI